MDPALWELLRAEAGADGDRELEAIIRLARPGIEIPDIRIVSRFGTVATCRIRARDIVPVRARRDVLSLKAARGLSPGFEPAVGATVLDALGRPDFRPADVRRNPGLTLTGKGVVVASVDWGVDVDSAAFRWAADPAATGGDRPAGGTRFLSFWDQRDLASGPRPDPYGYGTVHDREQIDRALHDPMPYEQLGYHPAIADRGGHGTHGTHVLDIAAGNGQAGGPAGIAPYADLIFVHLADRTTGGLTNLGDSVRLLEAVDFISRTARSQPCVINISAGRTCGPKDGTTLVERALDELLATTPGRFVVNSAGNYFGWRTHSCGRIAPGESRSLTLIIDPADITLNELEIWYDSADEFAVRIDPPGYTGGRALRLGERSDLLIEGRAVGRVYHRKHDPNNGDNHIVAYIDPIARAGNWTVTLEARKVKNGRFHAWVERDDSCPGCQARFTLADSNSVTTIGTIATSQLPLIVGAYAGHDPARPVAPFSSSGPSRDLRPKPDLAAPGVDVLAARSASIIDSHNPGLLVRKSGTSMAAPHVTGAVALCLEAAGNALSARQIRSLVLDSCDQARGPEASHRLGRGYLNIPRLIADLQRTLTAPNAKESTMNTDDSIVLLAAAPDTAYREYLYRPHSQLARWIGSRFDIVARPGQRIDHALQLGDVLLEVTLGQARPGRCLVLRAHDPELEVSPRRLSAGQLLLRPRKRAEMSEPLPIEPIVETEGSNPATDLAAGAPTAAVPDFRQLEEAAIRINVTSVTIDQAATKAVDLAKLLEGAAHVVLPISVTTSAGTQAADALALEVMDAHDTVLGTVPIAGVPTQVAWAGDLDAVGKKITTPEPYRLRIVARFGGRVLARSNTHEVKVIRLRLDVTSPGQVVVGARRVHPIVFAGPIMPVVTARVQVEGIRPDEQPGQTREVRLHLSYIHGNRADNHFLPGPGAGDWQTLTPGVQTWTPAWPDFWGGEVEVFAQASVDGVLVETQTPANAQVIWGQNPPKGDIRNAIGADHTNILVVAHRESRFTQFSDTIAIGTLDRYRLGPLPVLRTSDNGFGIGQLTNPVPTQRQIWNWAANAAEMVARLSPFRANSLVYQRQVQNGLPWTAQTGGNPPNEKVAYSAAPNFTADQLDLEMWARYNSGYRYHNYDPPTNTWLRRIPAPGGAKTGLPYADALLTMRQQVDRGVFPAGW